MGRVGFGPQLQPGGNLRQRHRHLPLPPLRDLHFFHIAFPLGRQSGGIPLALRQRFRHDPSHPERTDHADPHDSAHDQSRPHTPLATSAPCGKPCPIKNKMAILHYY